MAHPPTIMDMSVCVVTQHDARSLVCSRWCEGMHLLGSDHGGELMESLVHILHGSHLQHESGYLAPPHLHHPYTPEYTIR